MRPSNEDARQVSVLLSTCAPADAERLANFLVGNGHAACVNILPQITSVYRWKGNIERDSECLLIVKCPSDRLEAVTDTLVKEHPYDVPEVITLDVKGGNAAYLDWVLESVGGR